MAKTETDVSNLKINRGTYAKIQENISSIGTDELIIVTDKQTPIPTTNDNGKVVAVSSGDYTLKTLTTSDISDISTNYQEKDGDLTAIAELSGTSGLLKKTAANTWTLDNSSYVTGSVTTTTGSEAVTIDSNSVNVVTRDTVQTISANKVFSGSLYLSNVAGSIHSEGSSKLNFGSPNGTVYSYLSSNTSGAFALAKDSSHGFVFYPGGTYSCLMPNFEADLGRSDTNGNCSWRNYYTRGDIYKHVDSTTGFVKLTLPTTAGTIALTSDISSAVANMVTTTDTLTADTIPLGNGNKALKVSTYKAGPSSVTWSDSSDVYLPTMKSVKEYVEGKGYTTSSTTLTTTTGSEAITVDSNTLSIVTRNTAQTITGEKTITSQTKFANGAAAGCVIFGGNVGSTGYTANTRKLARLTAPTYEDAGTKFVGFVSIDTNAVSGGGNGIEFGSRQGDTTSYGADYISFSVGKSHNSTDRYNIAEFLNSKVQFFNYYNGSIQNTPSLTNRIGMWEFYNNNTFLNNSYTYTLPNKAGTIALLGDIPSVSLTTTTGSEAITVDNDTLNVVTRDTTQTITGQKTFSSRVNFTGEGDANAIFLTTNTRIDVYGTTQTVLGFGSGNFYINHSNYKLVLRGKGSRPTYNSNDLALTSDLTSKLDVKPDGTNNLIDSSTNKINETYIPDYILGQLVFGGTVNANTAVATLSDGAKSKLGTSSATITLTNDTTAITGYVANESIYYVVSTAGTFAGIAFKVGDWLISLGSAWGKVDNTDEVTSVNSKTGAVTLNASDVGAVASNTAITGATKCKITYDAKGLVTAGADLTASDIPDLSSTYVAKNTAITGATKCKITYDAKGLVTSGADLAASDIPNLSADKITSGTFADARIASASTWNTKQDALTTTSVADGTLTSFIGFDANGNIKKGTPSAVTVDTTVTDGSNNPVSSDAVYEYAQPKGSYLASSDFASEAEVRALFGN